MQLKKFSLSTIAGFTLGLLLVGYTVLAWSVPSQSAPNGNMPPPLNTGTADQIKTGGTLTLQGDIVSENKTIWGDDVNLGAGDPGKKIAVCGDLVLRNQDSLNPMQKIALHACDGLGNLIALFDNSGTQQIALNPQDKTITAGIVTVKGDGTISPGLNSSKLQDLDAASLMAAGGGATTLDPYKYIYFYLSKNIHNGNMGGLTGANAICGNEKPLDVPSGLTYKAYLCDGTQCQKPTAGTNTIVIGVSRGRNLGNYIIVNPLKSPDFVSVSALFGKYQALKNGLSGIYDDANPITHGVSSFLSETVLQYWTGASAIQYINANSIIVYDYLPSSSNCNSWTDNSGIVRGAYGESDLLLSSSNWMFIGSPPCDGVFPIICFAQ